ncbi:DUF3710 domain-containing protein [Brevibacterium litoralis]|uniref:DUF3710 domain-containing protein n=1 Tax=Brevibacterium litoralis TaxID=3138935 RepID=UPI0032EF59F3
MGLFSFLGKKNAPQPGATDDDRDLPVDAEGPEDTGDGFEDDVDEDLVEKSAPADRTEAGPFDEDDEIPAADRVDLGSLRVPVKNGMQVRLDVKDKTKKIVAVTLVLEGGSVQLSAFAAPKSEGLWETVRTQIAENTTKNGGQVADLYSDLGRELLTKTPVKLPDGRVGLKLTRFAGVDGPRWFLRAVYGGKALGDEDLQKKLQDLVRGTVVVRGTEAMPPREMLPLREPKAAPAGSDKQTDEGARAAERSDDLNPFERGPEITEVR